MNAWGHDDEHCWIVLTESNRFAWPGSDLRPLDANTGYYGPLPQKLFEAPFRGDRLRRCATDQSAPRTE